MRKSMMNFGQMLLAGCLCTMVTAGVASAEEEAEKPSADMGVSMLSKYVWRGFELSKDSLVVQPSLTVGYKGVAVNMWANVDTDQHAGIYGSAPDTHNLNETDLTLSYDGSAGMVSYGVGYIYYAIDSGEDTQELYGSISLDVPLAPSLTIYRDIDHLVGWYVSLDAGHSFELADALSLDLGAHVGYLSADDASSYADSKGGAYSEFHDGQLAVSMTYSFADYFSVTPELYYSFPLSSEAKTELTGQANEYDFIYGGVTVGMAF